MFEKPARVSLFGSMAPTVTAFGTPAGERLQAFNPELLPAAATYVTPEAIELFTARSIAAETGPPRLILATAGSIRLAVTQSTPAITVAVVRAHVALPMRTE